MAEEALQSKDEEETIELWNGPALFDGHFPTTVRGLGAKALRAKAAMKAGGLYAGSSGHIGFDQKENNVEVPDNRGFFGDG